MKIAGLNHFNIATPDLEGTAKFYERLGLRRGHRPDFGNTGLWLFLGDKPIVHLNLESEVGPIAKGTGVVHYVGFDVRGSVEEVCRGLNDLSIEHRLWPTPVGGWYRALYFEDPNGVQIEYVLVDCYVKDDRSAVAA